MMAVAMTDTQGVSKLSTSGLPNVRIDAVGEQLEILVNIR